MARGARHLAVVAAAAATSLTLACTATPGPDRSAPTAPAGRALAGEPLVACTIAGERPVHAVSPALCGRLRVPEDRSDPGGRQVRLRVAVVPAVTGHPEPDPLFVLAGGPGEAATQFFAWFPGVFGAVHATRDIVLVDQRGTGRSHPLRLPWPPPTAGLPPERAGAVLSRWATRALSAIHADPRFYTSTVAADDLDDVRAALGYDDIDLYGTSYGGTLAQYYLRQHGEHVRAAVLDGATPVDVPALEQLAPSSQAALDLLLRRCAGDAACHAAFPRIAHQWDAVLDTLATPVTITDPETGKQARITRAMVANAVHTALLTAPTAAQLPLAIHLMRRAAWLRAARIIGTSPQGDPTLLMRDEILCSEAWARFDPAEAARLGAGSYALPVERSLVGGYARLCPYLPQGVVPPDDAEAVRTDVPVLWLTGDGDPQDPPANLRGVPAQEPSARVVVMPAQQHVVGHLGCLPSVTAAFLDAGTAEGLDTSCVADGAPAPPFRTR